MANQEVNRAILAEIFRKGLTKKEKRTLLRHAKERGTRIVCGKSRSDGLPFLGEDGAACPAYLATHEKLPPPRYISALNHEDSNAYACACRLYKATPDDFVLTLIASEEETVRSAILDGCEPAKKGSLKP